MPTRASPPPQRAHTQTPRPRTQPPTFTQAVPQVHILVGLYSEPGLPLILSPVGEIETGQGEVRGGEGQEVGRPSAPLP